MHLVALAVDGWLMLSQLLEDLGSRGARIATAWTCKSLKMHGKGTLRTCGTLFQIRASSLAVRDWNFLFLHQVYPPEVA